MGKLSFSIIGGPDGDHNASHYNSLAHEGKVVVAIEKRASGDGAGGRRLTKIAHPNRISAQTYVLCARAAPAHLPRLNEQNKIDLVHDQFGKLEGEMLIVLKATKLDEITRSVWQQITDYKSNIVSEPSRDYVALNDDHCLNGYKAIKNALADARRNECFLVDYLKCEFELYRSGECNFFIPDGPGDVIRVANISSEEELIRKQPELRQKLAQQFFIFLKDLTHRHYHHDARADKKTLVFPSKGDDGTWRRETLYGLTRMALEARRSNKIDSYINAAGVIAYADSFQRHLAGWVRPDSRSDPEPVLDPNFSSYDFSALKSSIDARRELLVWQQNKVMPYIGIVFALIFGLVALFFSMNSIIATDDASDLPEYFVSFATLISRYPLFTLVLIPIILSVFVAAFYKVGPFDASHSYVDVKRFYYALTTSIFAKAKIKQIAFYVSAFLQGAIVFAFLYLARWMLIG